MRVHDHIPGKPVERAGNNGEEPNQAAENHPHSGAGGGDQRTSSRANVPFGGAPRGQPSDRVQLDLHLRAEAASGEGMPHLVKQDRDKDHCDPGEDQLNRASGQTQYGRRPTGTKGGRSPVPRGAGN